MGRSGASMSVGGPGSAGPEQHGTDVITMDGSVTARPPGGRGAKRPVRAAVGRGGGGAAPGPGGAGAGGDGANVAPVPGGGAAVSDGGSVAAGAVWGALVAAHDDEALSVMALMRRAGASRAEVERALERFEAAALVLCVPGGRRAGLGWMLAGGVREGLGIAQDTPTSGGYGHAGALAVTGPAASGAEPGAAVAEVDLSVSRGRVVDRMVKPPRLAKGELEARVLATLRKCYPEEFGPLGLSREIGGYSSGAVSNALVRLHAKGRILQTCLAPKRYAALPPQAQDDSEQHRAS